VTFYLTLGGCIVAWYVGAGALLPLFGVFV
jgi:hypothetical protein